MLKKLLKYEFAATGRLMLPCYGILVAFAALCRIFGLIPNIDSPIAGIPLFFIWLVYIIALIGVFGITYVVIIMRYYKNILGDEGYLTNTLPVKPATHLNSKMIAAAVWMFLTTVLMVVTLIISSDTVSNILKVILEAFKEAGNIMGISPTLFLAETGVSLVVGLFSGILMLYASMSIGHLFSRHRVIGSFAAYFGLNMALQTISSVLVAVLVIFDGGVSFLESTRGFHILLLGSNVLSIVTTVGLYFLSLYILRKKLNLE